MKAITSISICCILTLLITLPVLALPTGYQQSNLNLGRTCSNVFAVDVNEVVYYGHASSKNRMIDMNDGRGQRAPADEIWMYDTSDGTHTLLYSANNHSAETHQIKSASGMTIDTSTTPWIFYVADQDPADDPWTHGGVWRCQDGNADDDFDDAGETVLVTADDAMISIEGIILDPVSGELFASNAGGPGTTLVYRMEDLDFNEFFEPGEIVDYFLEPGSNYGGKLCFDHNNTSVIYTADSGGNCYRLEDTSGDGDAQDPGESDLIAAGLAGGYGIAVDPESDIFVTASDFMSGAHILYEIVPGTPATVSSFDDLAPFAAWTGPIAFGNGASFASGVSGATLYMSYTDLAWGDPTNLATYQGLGVDVPSTSAMGLLLLLIVVSILVIRLK